MLSNESRVQQSPAGAPHDVDILSAARDVPGLRAIYGADMICRRESQMPRITDSQLWP